MIGKKDTLSTVLLCGVAFKVLKNICYEIMGIF